MKTVAPGNNATGIPSESFDGYSLLKTCGTILVAFAAIGMAGFPAGCTKEASVSPVSSAATIPVKHEHHTPHGGTPVVLGDESYHLELVLDPAAGKLQAFVLDGEMENFVRSTAASFEVIATIKGEKHPLVFQAVADAATGEKIGDTALFEATADWLKSTPVFDAVLTSLAIRGTSFEAVKFNFPSGNDRD